MDYRNNRIWFAISDDGTDNYVNLISNFNSFELNRWYHIVAVYDYELEKIGTSLEKISLEEKIVLLRKYHESELNKLSNATYIEGDFTFTSSIFPEIKKIRELGITFPDILEELNRLYERSKT